MVNKNSDLNDNKSDNTIDFSDTDKVLNYYWEFHNDRKLINSQNILKVFESIFYNYKYICFNVDDALHIDTLC